MQSGLTPLKQIQGMDKQMKLNIQHIAENGLSVIFSEKKSRFPLLIELENEGDVLFINPVNADIYAGYSSDSKIEITGKIEVGIEIGCDRCLEKFNQLVKTEFRIFFSDIPQDTDNEEAYSEDGYEIKPEAVEIELFSGDIIELRDTLQEQILLSLPHRAICNSSCKGLCQKCGVNLNSTECSCEINSGHPAFAALQALKKH